MKESSAKLLKLLSGLSTAAVASLLTSTAAASPPYPVTIQLYAKLAKAPDCVLCHRDDNGGAGTVVRPFGRTLMHLGATGANNIGALNAALKTDEADHLDSDGDGATDIQELRAGTNPNIGSSGQEATPDFPLPETGCALAAGGSRPLPVTIGAAFTGFALLRRRFGSRKRPLRR